jgi:hypothetical protein
MADKLSAGQSVPIKADGQVFEIQPGFVEIKKERKKLSGRWVQQEALRLRAAHASRPPSSPFPPPRTAGASPRR